MIKLVRGLFLWSLLLAGLAGCRTQPAPVPVVPAPLPPAASKPAQRSAPSPAPALVPAHPVAPASPPAVAPPPAASDAEAVFIASLERQFEAAMDLYRRGQMDEARQGFDATLDRLLASPYSIPDHPRLQKEYDSLVDRVQALESDILQTGGLTNIRPSPTPLQQIPELTFPIAPALRAEIERETKAALAETSANLLPIQLNDAVMRYVHYFTTTGRADLELGFRRAARFRPMVDRILRAEGVPTDLIFLAQLESDFDPRLLSSAGARGMWQLMPSRAEEYGLVRTHWVDQRDDPEKATQAAAHHLSDLYKEFGTWNLAMAAYNGGPGTVDRLVARTGYADYWKWYDMGALPKYLRSYVPVIQALALIGRDPQAYGIPPIASDPPPRVETVTINHPLDVRLAAECAEITLADLQRLNPSLNYYEAPAGFTLQLPAGTKARFEQALARVPADHRLYWRVHWARAGDSWAHLARRYKVSASRLATLNHLALSHAPRPGTPLVLPTRISDHFAAGDR